VNYCEIDKYASKSFSIVHGVSEELNLGDITKVDETKIKDIDLITYGFPCQDISVSGKQRGLFNADGSKTRSGLFFDALRIIKATKPKVAIAENVKNLLSKKFKEQFNIVINSLNEAGYNCYYKVLNSKDFGIPQNRERVFIVSIRKDLDNLQFQFPKPFELKLRLKDVLEPQVEEKYYLSKKTIDYVMSTGTKNYYYKPEIDLEVARPLTATMHKMHRAGQDNYVSDGFIKAKSIQVAQLYGTEVEPNPQAGRVYSSEGISPTLDTCQGGNRMPKILETSKPIKLGNTSPSGKSQCNDVFSTEGIYPTITAGTHGNCNPSIAIKTANKQGYILAQEGDGVDISYPNSQTKRGRVKEQISGTITCGDVAAVVVNEPRIVAMRGRNPEKPSDRTPGIHLEQRLEPNKEGISNTLTSVQKDNYVQEANLKIRKLTPKECWRLQGFEDKDLEKCVEGGISDTQLYKQAGNSITVDVAYHLLEQVKPFLIAK
jgi:DNA (cytosine-5)-methyltransferase 1